MDRLTVIDAQIDAPTSLETELEAMLIHPLDCRHSKSTLFNCYMYTDDFGAFYFACEYCQDEYAAWDQYACTL